MKRAVILAVTAVLCMLGGAAAFSIADDVSFWLACYWSLETGTTVGYGDVTPRSGSAHIIAAAVMLTAIPLLGATFASLTAAHIHKRVSRRLDRHLDDVRDHIDRALTGTPSPPATEERPDNR